MKGRASHAGAAPDLGRNALLELSHRLLQTRDVAKAIPGAQLNWTVGEAGTARNQIPAEGSAIGDVRLQAADAAAKLRAALEAKLGEPPLVPDTEVRVRLEENRPTFVGSPASRALAARAQAIYAEIGGKMGVIEMTGGATDAGFAARDGKAVVLESFGLAGFGYHARDEFIVTDSIAPRLYLMTRLLTELGKE